MTSVKDSLEKIIGEERIEKIKDSKAYKLYQYGIVKKALEKTLGEERAKKVIDNFAYKFSADAVAMNLFSLLYILNEKFVAGMDWGNAWKTRGAAAIGNVVTGRPYGIYRDWVFRRFKVTEDSSCIKKYLVDVGTFATGQTPLYLLYLAAGGAEAQEMVKAATFLTFVAPLTGRPQGKVYDIVRHQCGMESAYVKNEKSKTD